MLALFFIIPRFRVRKKQLEIFQSYKMTAFFPEDEVQEFLFQGIGGKFELVFIEIDGALFHPQAGLDGVQIAGFRFYLRR